ncbi:hypothetical protein NHX12_023702 [Muraenolepis orangiensis]|uniref:Uncharacterized protein n=1 Tax=Muraenolepis orangiensis TaxID=630683 RepID=A0A9Q0IT11_9TELE|nr:hypothetical protein NHX12_023702 [Muraenolepis orangiensis]
MRRNPVASRPMYVNSLMTDNHRTPDRRQGGVKEESRRIKEESRRIKEKSWRIQECQKPVWKYLSMYLSSPVSQMYCTALASWRRRSPACCSFCWGDSVMFEPPPWGYGVGVSGGTKGGGGERRRRWREEEVVERGGGGGGRRRWWREEEEVERGGGGGERRNSWRGGEEKERGRLGGLAVVLSTVLHLDRRQAERLDHLVCPLNPIGGAEGHDGQAEGQ